MKYVCEKERESIAMMESVFLVKVQGSQGAHLIRDILSKMDLFKKCIHLFILPFSVMTKAYM